MTALKREVYILKNLSFGLIIKLDVLEIHAARRLLRYDCVRGALDLDRHVIVVKNSGEHGHRPYPVDLNIEQLVDRTVHFAKQGDQDRDITDCQSGIVFHHEDSADKIEQHGADACKCRYGHHEPPARHALSDVEADHFLICRLILFILRLLLAEQLHQLLPADGQSLVQDTVDLVIALLRFAGKIPSGLSGTTGGDHKERDDQHTDRSQDPVLPVHHDDSHRQRDDIGENAGHRVRNRALHAVNIARHAGDDIALIVSREEALRHFLQMAVHLISHVECNMLRNPCVEIALEHADQVGCKCDCERQQDQPDQSFHIPGYQTFVDDPSCQDRRSQRKNRRHQNSRKDEQHLLPVGFQIRKYS